MKIIGKKIGVALVFVTTLMFTMVSCDEFFQYEDLLNMENCSSDSIVIKTKYVVNRKTEIKLDTLAPTETFKLASGSGHTLNAGEPKYNLLEKYSYPLKSFVGVMTMREEELDLNINDYDKYSIEIYREDDTWYDIWTFKLTDADVAKLKNK